MSNIDKETVKHVALLSRLALDEREIAHYSTQLVAPRGTSPIFLYKIR
jgi:Asp-tRNA(Asn)/Glu-tRNA(Gln) amidotransferase C subunit